MQLRLTFWILIPVFMLGQNQPADRNADEAAIRDLIAHPQQIKHTEDSIFWSGAFPRPRVGSQHVEPFPAAQMGKRNNERDTLSPERIEVAGSGDMAYEFSYGKVEFDLEGQSTRHVAFDMASLHVWKKFRASGGKRQSLYVRSITHHHPIHRQADNSN
jgi:hypothetical protein